MEPIQIIDSDKLNLGIPTFPKSRAGQRAESNNYNEMISKHRNKIEISELDCDQSYSSMGSTLKYIGNVQVNFRSSSESKFKHKMVRFDYLIVRNVF